MGIFRAHLFKLLKNPLFYVGILGTAAVCAVGRVFGDWKGDSVVQKLDMMLDLDTMRKIIAVFSALPFAANFAEEWMSGTTTLCVSRCGAGKYAASNILLCFGASFMTAFVGLVFYTGALSLSFPIVSSGTVPETIYSEPLNFAYLTVSDTPYLYVVFKSVVFASSCAMWSVMGMMLSAFFPNKYVAVCSPFVASFVVERVTMLLPDTFNLYFLSLSRTAGKFGSVIGQLAYCSAVFAALSALLGFEFYITVKGRVQNEIS